MTPKRTPPPGDRAWSVYMLRCSDGSLYTGCTNDLRARLVRHREGRGARYTRSRLPVRLVFAEAAADRGAALRREAALKRLTREEKLATLRAAKLRPPGLRAAPSAAGPPARPAPRRSPRQPRCR